MTLEPSEISPLGLHRHQAKPLFIEINPMAGQVN